MFERRTILFGSLATLLTGTTAAAAGKRIFSLRPAFRPQIVNISGRYPSGTVLIDVRGRFLYLAAGRGNAIRYGVGVGKAGLAFSGTATVGRKEKWPSWTPTNNMIKRDPAKYLRYAGGVSGGPHNPLGARALYLYRDGRDTYYRIHGTNEPWTIGKAVSSGCIRMMNEHVVDLYERVPLGATVIVL
ncbi:L,D-transpeptidase [Ensifer sp. P24N7]|uniref:L,D-transpeptidase n=1 Tax=Sinorhizobium sp. P24N7 TaxID=3348358 RepID=UPI0035F49905